MTILVRSPLYCLTGRPHFYFPHINTFVSLSPALMAELLFGTCLTSSSTKKDIFYFYFYTLGKLFTLTRRTASSLLSPGICYYMLNISLYYSGYSVLPSLCCFLWVASSSLKRSTVFNLPWKTIAHSTDIKGYIFSHIQYILFSSVLVSGTVSWRHWGV